MLRKHRKGICASTHFHTNINFDEAGSNLKLPESFYRLENELAAFGAWQFPRAYSYHVPIQDHLCICALAKCLVDLHQTKSNS
jgi:hypothetical protein